MRDLSANEAKRIRQLSDELDLARDCLKRGDERDAEHARLNEQVSDLMRELVQVRATNTRLDAALGNLDAENARLHEIIDDKKKSICVEIAAKQGAHNLIRIMEMALRRAVRALDEEQAIQPESQIHHELKDALS